MGLPVKAVYCEVYGKHGWYHGRLNPFRPAYALTACGTKGIFCIYSIGRRMYMCAQSTAILAKEDLRKKLLKPDVISGSEILLRSLLLEGVDCVFGYPGGAVLYIYDAM